MKSCDRVQAHTADHVNRRIESDAKRRVMEAAGENQTGLQRRINELDQEWDVERFLEINASAIAFSGTLLGLLVNRKFFAIPCLVLPFLFLHATQGWCPPIPILRRLGIRTRREIDHEKYALKALRGDFIKQSDVGGGEDPSAVALQAFSAATP